MNIDMNSIAFAPAYVGVGQAWMEHVTFGHWLVGALRPRKIVELGVHSGLSYLTFCQAAVDWGLSSVKCYGVDTWEGDDGTGKYGPEVLAALRDAHKPYELFSTLVRARFENAVEAFDDGSIDLLHIDGFHSYDAVKRDWSMWRSKLAPDGICLFHDSAVPHFGVKDVVAEIRNEGKPVFEFLHGFGLAVVANGAIRASMAELFGPNPDQVRQEFLCPATPRSGVLGRRGNMDNQIRFMVLSHDARMLRWCQNGILRRGRGSVRHIYNDTGIKLPAGYNLLAKADALEGGKPEDILAFIHHDCRLEFNYDNIIPAYFDSVGPMAGVLGFVGNEQIRGELPCWWGRWGVGGLEESWERGKHMRRFGVPPVRGKEGDHELRWQPVEVLDCTCLFVRRKVYDAIGGFSEYLPGWHLHDIDFCLKAHHAGYVNACIEEHLWHIGWALIGTGPKPNEWTAFKSRWAQHLGLAK